MEAVMKKLLFIALLIALIAVASSPVVAQIKDTQYDIHPAGSKETCWSWWKIKFCVKTDYALGKARVGIKLPAIPYMYVNIVQNGCFNANPSKLLANMKYCVKNFVKPTKANNYTTSFSFQLQACVGVWKWQSCQESSWFNFKVP